MIRTVTAMGEHHRNKFTQSCNTIIGMFQIKQSNNNKNGFYHLIFKNSSLAFFEIIMSHFE